MESNRECGSCTLCCKLLHIPEFDAPAGMWCLKCNPKKGCIIHGDHPDQCKKFKCLWILGLDIEKNRPDHSKIVMKFVKAHQDGVLQLQIYCDQGSPNAWKTPLIQKMIDRHTEKNGRTIIIYGEKRIAIGKPEVLKKIKGRKIK